MIKKVALLVAGAAALTLTATATMAASPAQMAQDPPPAAKAAPLSAGVPASLCRTGFGYFREGSRLCMTSVRGPATFANATVDCADIFGRVADYSDWRYRFLRGDGAHAPVGWWLGPITADNTALFVNQDNPGDFDGETNRFESRFYACAHDLF
jgi:hypothetical protein